MAGGVNEVGVSVPGINFHRIHGLAKRVGRLEAASDYYHTLYEDRRDDFLSSLKAKQDRQAARQKSAQDAADSATISSAAADAESEDPESGGFWDKVGDVAGAVFEPLKDGAEWTMDKINRGSYAANNAYGYIQDQDKDIHRGDQTNGMFGGLLGTPLLNAFDDLNIGDVGGALKAGWEGFQGHEKRTMSENIKRSAESYPDAKILKNSWYQGIVGFVGDVAFDPLSYVGAGLVTKPLAKAAEKGAEKGLAEDLASQGLSYTSKETGEEIAYSADDFRNILKETADQPNVVPVGLTRRQRRIWTKQHTLTGRALYKSKATQVAQTRGRIKNLSKISEELGKRPERLTSASLEALGAAGKKASEDYAAALASVGSRTMHKALANIEEKAVIKGVAEPGQFVEPLFKGAELHDLESLVKSKSAITRLDKKLEGQKLSMSPKELASTKAYRASLVQGQERLFSKWGPEGTAVAKGLLKELDKYEPHSRQLKELQETLKGKYAAKAEAEKAGDPALAASIQGHIGHLYGRKDTHRAVMLHRLMDYHQGNKSVFKFNDIDAQELGEIDTRLERLRPYLDENNVEAASFQHQGGLVSAAPSQGDVLPENLRSATDEFGDPVEAVTKGTPAESSTSEAITTGSARTEAKTLHARKQEILAEYLGRDFGNLLDDMNPEDIKLFDENNDIIPVGDHSKEAALSKWAETEMQGLEESYYAEEVDRYLNKRKDLRSKEAGVLEGEYKLDQLPAKIQPMFGRAKNSKAVVPKITVDGQVIHRATVDKKLLAPHITEGDKTKAADRAWGGTTARSDPAYIAFDRLFKKEHGKSVESAIHDLDIATGKYVTPFWGGGEKITRDRIVDWAVQHPEEYGTSMGIKIPWEGGGSMTYKKFKEANPELTPAKIRGEWGMHVQKWIDDAHKAGPAEFAKVETSIKGTWDSLLPKEVARRKATSKSTNRSLDTDERAMLRDKAKQRAADHVKAHIKDQAHVPNNLIGHDIGSHNVTTAEELHTSSLNRLEADEGEAIQELKDKAPVGKAHDDPEVMAAKAEMDAVHQQFETTRQALDEAYAESIKVRKEVKKRLDEEITLHAIEKTGVRGKTGVRVRFMGARVLPDLPLHENMFKAVEKFSQMGLVGKAYGIWADSFRPASKLDPDLNLMRLRAQSRTPELIKYHVQKLSKAMGGIRPNKRAAALTKLRKGAALDEDAKKIEEGFDELIPYINGSKKIGKGKDAVKLTAFDINKYLPEEFTMYDKAGVHVNRVPMLNGKDIISSMRGLREGSDPMKALWSFHIAAEQAMAHMAMKHNINKMFGVRRQLRKNGDIMDEKGGLIEQLHTNHEWRTVRDMGQDYYFPPEVASDVERLLQMMKPQNIHKGMQFYDKVLRTWKSSVTVYNPGYYTRNGIGESFMCMIDGMGKVPTDVKFFGRAGKIIGRKRPDSTKQALAKMDPFKKTNLEEGGRNGPGAMLRDGTKLTEDQVWYLYHEAGLKSGFISTEYDTVFPAADTLRSGFAGKIAHNVNESVRAAGEKYEDYFRLAHFMYRLEKAPRDLNPSKAAEWAANFVRKYHFDYTDFTPFEKAYMVRLFPFYKWTRKAMPLMASTLFTKPGAVSFYPKLMSGMSVGTGAVDPMEDKNGYAPNYAEAVPDWMQNMLAYPIGPNSQGNEVYSNIATPYWDVQKQASSPVSTFFSMLSPIIRVPTEEMMGQGMDPAFNFPFTTLEQHRDHIMRSTPLTSLFAKKLQSEEDATPDDSPFFNNGHMNETLKSFLTGLGFYENTPGRKSHAKGEDTMNANKAAGG